MKTIGHRVRLSATDLASHAACRHLTTLELAAAREQIAPPERIAWLPASLQQRGEAHELAFVAHLRSQGREIVDLRECRFDAAGFQQTADALRSGVDIVLQAPLAGDGWIGRADVLQRIDRPSTLGGWSYQPLDTKLARETRGSTILQLCAYADMLGALQGTRPEWMRVIAPGQPFAEQAYRVDDFFAYYTLVRRRLQSFVSADAAAETYPDPVAHCEICRWQIECLKRRRRDDHLGFVAGIRTLQIAELAEWDIATLATFGAASVPFARRPRRVSIESLERVHGQARIQLEGRTARRLIHEPLPLVIGDGLHRLPVPSPGDVFFDLEGDPFVGESGHEFLFGYAYRDESGGWTYIGQWAVDAAQEKQAFEELIAFLDARLARYPDLHVYHYAAYEAGAIRRLMGKHAVCEDQVDRLLRGQVLVDLYAIARQAVRASVERYSIKDLEPFYGFARQVPLTEVGAHLRAIQLQLELGDTAALPSDASRAIIEGYNRDDCLSARDLRDWLESLRADWERQGTPVPRPVAASAEPTEELNAQQVVTRALMTRLLAGLPADAAERTTEQQARWLLAQLLEFHRREDKAVWWDFFRLAALGSEDAFDEASALGGVEFVERVGGTMRAPIDRYRFPPQEITRPRGDARVGEALKIGTVARFDQDARTIDIKKTMVAAEVHPPAMFFHQRFNPRVLQDALFALGASVADAGVAGEGRYHALRLLLLNAAPVLQAGAAWRLPDESPVARARRLAVALRDSVLAVQGPPGSGKTHTGAQMACALVRAGCRVGVTGTSHRVIRHLLDTIIAAAAAEGLPLRGIQKVNDDEQDGGAPGPIVETTKNPDVLNALQSGDARVAAGTVWLWARPEFHEAVDVLIVDEAGQMSLANVLAAGQAARSLILLGDPQQLEQPLRGSHPIGTDASVLQHVLGPHQTLPDDRGLFLDETWRLSPPVCAFTSELFYEGRLRSKAGLERQHLDGVPDLTGAGLWYLPVEHNGNQNCSLEEVAAACDLVTRLTSGPCTWTDETGGVRTLAINDVLIVAPYNAQVYAIQERLPAARVGTVDRFQGQEAPVVIYSMATSSPEEAPRGMEFLYSLNRLNVATSRARGAVVLVASPKLFEPDCQTPRQMQLANAFCRYLEMARVISV